MKDSFIIYTKYEEQISLLSDTQAGVLFRALLCYQGDKCLPTMDGLTNMIFTVIRQQIDADNQAYEHICRTRKAAGAKGGRPSKSLTNKGNKAKKPNGFESEEEKAKKPNGFSKNQTFLGDNTNNQMVLERENIPNEEERSKEEDNTLKREIERKKEIDINIISNSACACDGKNDKTLTYENIISHYAGDIDAETRAAIWKYIQYFQAKTGLFILNEQLKVFLQNLKNNGLLFEGAILGCLNNDGIGMAMMELNDYDSVHGEENQGNK